MKLLASICIVSIVLSGVFALRHCLPVDDYTVQTTHITLTYWRGKKMTIRRISVRGLETYYWPEGP